MVTSVSCLHVGRAFFPSIRRSYLRRRTVLPFQSMGITTSSVEHGRHRQHHAHPLAVDGLCRRGVACEVLGEEGNDVPFPDSRACWQGACVPLRLRLLRTVHRACYGKHNRRRRRHSRHRALVAEVVMTRTMCRGVSGKYGGDDSRVPRGYSTARACHRFLVSLDS